MPCGVKYIIAALIVKMAGDLKNAGSPVDHSADIEALKQKLADAVSAASAPAVAPAPVDAPAAS